jgi:hypothetical protein
MGLVVLQLRVDFVPLLGRASIRGSYVYREY